MTFGCNSIASNLSWQLPLILQAFACVIVCCAVFFIPESPRFLMANGREDEAIAFLVRFHGNRDPSSKLVQLEIEEMREGISQEGIDKTWWDCELTKKRRWRELIPDRPLFFTKNGRWRMSQVLMISIFGQFSGNGLGYFNVIIFKNLGIEGASQQLGYNLLNSVISAVGALTAVSLTDRMPRRPVLIWGTLACAGLLAINSGLSAVLDKQVKSDTVVLAVGQGALAAYFMFNVVFSFTYTPLQGVIPAEALETTMRAKGLAASGIIVNGIGFINQFATPVALKNIGYKFIFIFVAWDCFESLMWYFFW